MTHTTADTTAEAPAGSWRVLTGRPAPESRLGAVLDGRYRLDAVLGAGGFGAVYRARHLELDHDVALKVLHPGVDDHAGRRLTREAKILARLDHPNCVRILDFGRHEGAPYLVMEKIAGRPLAEALTGPWPPARAVDMAIELLAGLAHAHGLGLVHRDLKPGNVLVLDQPDARATVKIIDFGIVMLAAGEHLGSFAEQLTATGQIIGTPRYMSPEQLLGANIDARSDLYALGLMLYEMLAGHPPFAAVDAERLARLHAVAPPPPLPDRVPDELARVIDELLAKPPERRPATADHVRTRLLALRPALVGMQATTSATPPIEGGAPTITGAAPTRVSHYRLLAELGRGATGVVYLAEDEALGRRVALKVLHASAPEQRASERMAREAWVLARVNHPNVVTVFEIGSHRGALFVAMQHVQGRTLRAWLGEARRDWRDTLAVLVQAARGLAAVHAAGLVHRDVKPENILVGDDGRARVVDFGLARSTSPALDLVDRLLADVPTTGVDPLAARLTRTGAIIGTPAYMALEQLAGDRVDARTDLFAFCVVAYEALHGERPFVGASLDELAAHLTAGQLRPRPGGSNVPRAVDEALAVGLRVMPASRWPSMDALVDALELAGGLRRARARPWKLAAGLGVPVLAGLVWALARAPEAAPANVIAERDEVSTPVEELRVTATRPEDPSTWRDTLELAARPDPPLTVRAQLHAIAGWVHDGYAAPQLGPISALAWSPTGPLLALARRDGGVLLWHDGTRELARTLAHGEPLTSLVFSRDGELLLAHGRTGPALLWHVATGTELGRIAAARVISAGFVAETRGLVIASDRGVTRWTLVRGKELVQAATLTAEVVVAAALAGPETVALLSSGAVHAWTREGEARGHVALADLDVGTRSRAPVFAADGSRVAWTRADGLDLWDAGTGRRLAAISGAGLGEPVFSSDAHWLAVTARGRAPIVLDAHTGERRATAAAIETRALAFDATRARLHTLADDGTLTIVDLRSGRVIDRIVAAAAGPRGLAVRRDGRRLATIGDDGLLQVWTGASVAFADDDHDDDDAPIDDPEVLLDLAAAPDGERMVALTRDGRVRSLDTATGAVVRTFSGPHWLRAAMPAPDRLLALADDGRVVGWSITSGDEVLAFAAGGPVTAVAAARDGSTIATASGAWPARIELWTADGRRSGTIDVDGDLRALAFSAAGDRLASAGIGPRVDIWSLPAGARLGGLRTGEPEVHALVFSPDATLLAVGGDEAHLWRLDPAFDLATLAGSPVRALAFTDGGQRVLLVGEDGARRRRWIDERALRSGLCRALADLPVAGDVSRICALDPPEHR